jgi:hypothetical protein
MALTASIGLGAGHETDDTSWVPDQRVVVESVDASAMINSLIEL